MKKLHLIIHIAIVGIIASITCSCHSVPEQTDNARGNFEALWTIIDEHYCFFKEKGVDWDAVHDKYARRIGEEMTREELFTVCSDMLDELRDGHVNLTSSFNTSYYRKWWSDYPQNFSKRLIEESYFNFNYRQTGGLMYGLLNENIGYIYYGSFTSPVGEGNLDNVLYFLSAAQGLIIDVRDNGGGNLTNVETFVARFITEPTVVGYISHKTGPGHDEFSEPRAITYNPADIGRIRWGKPIIVLANRSTFSAANNFVSVMKLLPGVKVVGVLYFLSAAQGLIIDVRDNGGGNLTNVETFVARFITEPTVVGYISHKTGPGHDEFSEPRAITYNPADIGRIRWGKPIIVLANRSTFSAANNFVSVMKLLPGVKVVGAVTGGGSGVPFSSEIPCGWSVRFSACSMLDAERRSTEQGVSPTEGCAVDLDPLDALQGKDTILEFAINLFQSDND